MTEPEAGSDLTSLTTHAVEDGDDYILNGRKVFITGGGHASHYMVYTRFSDAKGYKAIGGLLVEKGLPGFTFGKQEEFIGLQRHALLRPDLRGCAGPESRTWW